MEMQQMLERLLAGQEQIMADRIADREQRKAEREADREQSKVDVEQIFAKMEERMTATQTKTEGKLKELTETIKETHTEPKEEMMQSAEEHQDVPRDDAVVKPVRERKNGIGAGSKLQGDV
jgi:hypothetical protein